MTDAHFYILNPKEVPSVGVMLNLSLGPNKEVPLIFNSDGLVIQFSGTQEYGEYDKIEPTPEFWNLVNEIPEDSTEEHMFVWVENLPPKLPHHEKWALECLYTYYAVKRDRSNELMLFFQEAERRPNPVASRISKELK